MIAKYNGYCRVTNQAIIAGQTNIEKINGKWQVANRTNISKPTGATISMFWIDSYQDRWGDEYGQWHVAFGDDDGEPVGKIWKMSSRDTAEKMALDMMYEHRLADCVEYS